MTDFTNGNYISESGASTIDTVTGTITFASNAAADVLDTDLTKGVTRITGPANVVISSTEVIAAYNNGTEKDVVAVIM